MQMIEYLYQTDNTMSINLQIMSHGCYSLNKPLTMFMIPLNYQMNS